MHLAYVEAIVLGSCRVGLSNELKNNDFSTTFGPKKTNVRDVARSGTGELGLAGSDTLCQAWLWWACKCLGNAADRAAASAGDVNVQHGQRRVPCQ